MTRGGYRRKHVPQALTPEQVAQARQDHARGVTYKVLERTYQVSRYTLSRAIHGRRTYHVGESKPPAKRGVRARR